MDSNRRQSIPRAQWAALAALSLWRVVICFWEYDSGPFVSVSRTLLDQAPFWALLALMGSGYLGWRRMDRRASRLQLIAVSLLCVTIVDLVRFNGSARETLYTGSWVGEAHIAFTQEEPWAVRPSMSVTFTPGGQTVIALTTLPAPIHQGPWHLSLEPIRCSQSLTLPGFGRGEFWNTEDLHLHGTFRWGDRSYQLSAQLRQSRKGWFHKATAATI